MSPVVRVQAHDRLEAVLVQDPDPGRFGVWVLLVSLSVGLSLSVALGIAWIVASVAILMVALCGPVFAVTTWRSAPYHLRVDLHTVTIERRIVGRTVWWRTIPLADLRDVRVETQLSPQYGVDWTGLVLVHHGRRLFLPASEAALPELQPLAAELRAMAARAATAAGTPDAVAPALAALRTRAGEREGPR